MRFRGGERLPDILVVSRLSSYGQRVSVGVRTAHHPPASISSIVSSKTSHLIPGCRREEELLSRIGAVDVV